MNKSIRIFDLFKWQRMQVVGGCDKTYHPPTSGELRLRVSIRLAVFSNFQQFVKY